jgi:hypothetical protein
MENREVERREPRREEQKRWERLGRRAVSENRWNQRCRYHTYLRDSRFGASEFGMLVLATGAVFMGRLVVVPGTTVRRSLN